MMPEDYDRIRAMSSFFRMRPSERWFLILLVVFAAGSFLPWWRDLDVAGISISGWWIAALMIVSPVAALLIFVFERSRNGTEAQGSR